MRQHNHWKTLQLQKQYIKILLWGFGLGLLLFSFLLRGLSFNIVSGAIGIVLFLFGLAVKVFENHLWKKVFFQKSFYNNIFLKEYWTPVLEGRWKGTLIRDGSSHGFILEITQSYSFISCITYSKNSSSSAKAAEILFDEHNNIYKLVYYWEGKTRTVQKEEGAFSMFEGFTVLNIITEAEKVKKLEGEYFTNRQPKQTRGTLELNYEQLELKQSFD